MKVVTTYSVLSISELPSPPPGLRHRFVCNVSSNCSIVGRVDDFVDIDCTCHTFNLSLSWEAANGQFDVLHYLLNISSDEGRNITQNVTRTSATVSVSPDVEYLVLVSTVSKCQQISSPAMIEDGFVSVGKYQSR